MGVNVTYTAGTAATANSIRALFCKEAALAHDGNHYPLTDTDFNVLLDRIATEGFDAGRAYERGLKKGA